jgi:hypothetical protein
MKLNEINDMRAELIVSSVNKLINAGIKVQLITRSDDNSIIRGVVKEIKAGLPHSQYELRYTMDGVYTTTGDSIFKNTDDSEVDSFIFSENEMNNTELTKLKKDVYLLSIPNERLTRKSTLHR